MSTTECAFDGCVKRSHARGWCGTHYARWKRLGTVALTPYVTPPCSAAECDALSYSNGLCVKHYQRVRAHGSLDLPARPTLDELFWSIVTVGGPDECWPWARPPGVAGYGVLRSHGVDDYAHRIAYTLGVGSIPDGLTIDHLCHTHHPTCPGGEMCPHRRCCNPTHLEPVTRAENTRREVEHLRKIRIEAAA